MPKAEEPSIVNLFCVLCQRSFLESEYNDHFQTFRHKLLTEEAESQHKIYLEREKEKERRLIYEGKKKPSYSFKDMLTYIAKLQLVKLNEQKKREKQRIKDSL